MKTYVLQLKWEWVFKDEKTKEKGILQQFGFGNLHVQNTNRS